MSEIDPIITARELATHANDIQHLQVDMDKIIEEMKQVKEALQSIQETLAHAHGGWRTMMIVGGAFALIGGILANLFQGFLSK